MVHGDEDDCVVACPGALRSSSDSVSHGRTVSFSAERPEWKYYSHRTTRAGNERGYWSWARNDLDRPLCKSQTQRRSPRLVHPTVDVTSPQAIESMKQRSLQAQAAAIQNAISLSNGEGLQYEWDEDDSTVF